MGIITKVLEKRGQDKSVLDKKKMKDFKWVEMLKVAEVVLDEVILKRREVVVGILYDVDADGLFAGFILEDYLTRKGVEVKRYMNKKKKHGLQEENLETYIEDGLDWMFVVDAGSSDAKNINLLVENGMSVVVLDHHLYNNDIELNDPTKSWILNVVDKPELPKLSGCGVVYRFVEMLASFFEDLVGQYEKYVGITVLSDSCDMSDRENRYYVQRAYEEYRGNNFLQQFPFYGSWKSFYTYGVIPYLNACIRVGEENRVMEIINNMDNRPKMNKIARDTKRVKTKQQVLIDNIYEVSREIKRDGITYLLRREDEEEGTLRPVGGLTANQLVNKYEQPALVLNREGDKWVGSFRSNSYTKDTLEELGMIARGHDRACGVEVQNTLLQNIVKEFTKDVTDEVTKPEFRTSLSGVSEKVWMDIARFNEFSGTNMGRVLIKLRERYDRCKYIEEVGLKKRHIVFENGEVIDFTASEDIEITVEPVLKDTEYQLIRV